MTRCSEIMTKNPKFCLPQDKVAEAAKLMKSEDVGSIPILDDETRKKMVGIVTDRDLALKVLAEGKDPANTSLEEVMTRDPVTCHEEDELEGSLQKMEESQIRRIPVLGKDENLVGIIAQADIALRGSEDKAGELVKEVSR